MKQKPRNRLLLLLMGTSLMLLLGFQLFWLNQRYEQQEHQLFRELNFTFYKSIQEQQDSLLNRTILQPLINSLPDSIQEVDFLADRHSFDSHREPSVSPSLLIKGDTFSFQREGKEKERVQVNFVRPDEEEFGPLPGRFLRSLAFTLRGINDNAPTLLDFGQDSLRLADIDSTYGAMLAEEGIALPYQVFRLADTDTLDRRSGPGYYTRPMRGDIPIKTRYVAWFPNHDAWVWSRMGSLILFSIFLFLITAGSFYLVYRSLTQQQRLTEMKNSFISNVTHELQTPLTTVGVALEALSDRAVLKDPQQSQEYLDISKNELKRLSMLVDKVLKMALFEEDRLQINPESLDLKELVNSILETMKLRFEQVKAVVNSDFVGKNFTIQADKVHISSVFYNLLDNALKYATSNPNISVRLVDKTEAVELSVADNGIGIPNAYRTRIFEKFFRTPSGDLHNVKGHGLGLSYVATILEQHGGSVSVDSTPGKGSIFKIKLPRS